MGLFSSKKTTITSTNTTNVGVDVNPNIVIDTGSIGAASQANVQAINDLISDTVQSAGKAVSLGVRTVGAIVGIVGLAYVLKKRTG